MTSTINPEGYGAPIVGLFDTNGNYLSFASLGYEPDHDQTREKAHQISSCDLSDDEEEGIEMILTIESEDINFIDSDHFQYGNMIVIRYGYIAEDRIFFGRGYYLVVKDFRAKYADNIEFTLILVDQVTFASSDRDQSESQQILDRVEDAIVSSEGLNLSVEEYNEYISKHDDAATLKINLNELFMELNKIRANFKERSGEYLIKVPVGKRYHVSLGVNFGYLSFNTVSEFKQFFSTHEARDAYNLPLGIRNILAKGTDEQIFNEFAILRSEAGWWLRHSVVTRFPRDAVDLYGFTIDSHHNRNITRGEERWWDMLKEVGFYEKLKEHKNLYGRPNQSILYDDKGNFDPDRLDAFIQSILDNRAWDYVQADMNKSGYENLRTYLRERFGDVNISDTAEDLRGPRLRERNLDRPPYMDLHFKGTDDLLEIDFETNFEESEVVQSESVSVNPETGELVSMTQLHSNQTGNQNPDRVARYVDGAIKDIQEGKEPKPLENFSQLVMPGFRYDTGTHSYQDKDGNYVSGVDHTRVVKKLPTTIFLSSPITLDEIKEEIDSRRADDNLKRITAYARLLGNPFISSGMVFRVSGVAKKFEGLYYALEVRHKIDSQNGYTTELDLGKIPIQTVRGVIVEFREEEDVNVTKKGWVIKGSRLVQIDYHGNEIQSHNVEPMADNPNVYRFVDRLSPWFWDDQEGIFIPANFLNNHLFKDPNEKFKDYDILESIQQKKDRQFYIDLFGYDPDKPIPMDLQLSEEGHIVDVGIKRWRDDQRIEDQDYRPTIDPGEYPITVSPEEMETFLRMSNKGIHIYIRREYHLPEKRLSDGTIVSARVAGTAQIWEDNELLYTFKTLELPWRNNQRYISCIPNGRYKASPGFSSSKGQIIRLHDVPDREGILIHTGNGPDDSQGCILAGTGFDGNFILLGSINAMNNIMKLVDRNLYITIIG